MVKLWYIITIALKQNGISQTNKDLIEKDLMVFVLILIRFNLFQWV